MSGLPTVGLVMIVKDEEAVIERALRSALPFISTYVIVDTGSTDRTREIVREVFADLSGLLVDRPWVNFGANRTEALALCDGRMDWAIMLDADDNLAGVVPPPEVWTHSEIDAFLIRIQHGSLWHRRAQIFHTGRGWIYEGVVHEYPRCTGKERATMAQLPPETYMVTRCEGARSRDPEKYLKDAAILEAELLQKPTDHRTLFYLAQSYRDAGDRDRARRIYERYLDVSGGWDQERYMVLVNLIGLVTDEQDQIDLAWRAVELCPWRLEAQFTLLQRRRHDGRAPTQQMYALAAATKNRTSRPDDLFATPAVYDWGMDDELAVVAYGTGHYQEAYDALMRCVLNAPTEALRANAITNARVAAARLNPPTP